MSAKAATVAVNQHRRAEARREAAPAHLYTPCGAVTVPRAGRVGPKGRFSAVPSAGPGSRGRGRLCYLGFSYCFWGGGRKSGRGRREPVPPSGSTARGYRRALLHALWCRRRAVGWPRLP